MTSACHVCGRSPEQVTRDAALCGKPGFEARIRYRNLKIGETWYSDMACYFCQLFYQRIYGDAA